MVPRKKNGVTKKQIEILKNFVVGLNKNLALLSEDPHKVLDEGNLIFCIGKALMIARKERYKKNFHKVWAAHTICEISQKHPFVEANKRTSYVTALLILNLGGLDLEVKYGKAAKFIRKIARKKIHFKEVYEWIEKHSKTLETEIHKELREFVEMLRELEEDICT